ncbi:hypothetical protein ACROYT_G028400 [Oculina patagonica]
MSQCEVYDTVLVMFILCVKEDTGVHNGFVHDLFYHSVVLNELPSSLFDQNVYRKDRVHLTDKGNDILVRCFHHSFTVAGNKKCPPMSESSLENAHSNLLINDEDWPALSTAHSPCKPNCIWPTAKPMSTWPTQTPTSSQSTPKPTSTLPIVKPTSTKPTPKPTSTKPTPKPNSTKPTPKPTSTKPTPKPTSTKPTPKPTSTKPTPKPTSTKPTPKLSSTKPISTLPTPKPISTLSAPKPSFTKPTPKPTSTLLTPKHISTKPTPKPTSTLLTPKPNSTLPTPKPISTKPTPKPTSTLPTPKHISTKPTPKPTSTLPTPKHISSKTTPKPNLTQPIPKPNSSQSTPKPNTAKPTQKPYSSQHTPKPDSSPKTKFTQHTTEGNTTQPSPEPNPIQPDHISRPTKPNSKKGNNSPKLPYMIQVFVKDWHGKTTIFRLLQNATVSDLQKQILIKFKLPSTEYWLSGPGGNKMSNQEALVDLTTVHIRGRLLGGINKCCIRGCEEEASHKKITGLTGIYELKTAPDDLGQGNDLSFFICNHHYYFERRRGHKPKRLYSSVQNARKIFKTSEKAETNECFSQVGVKTCSLCKENIVVTKTTPCSQHILKLSTKYYMCACNCLDETRDCKIKDLNIERYSCISNKELVCKSDLEQNFICTQCSPTYFRTMKAEKSNDSLVGLAGKSVNESTQEATVQTSAENQPITFPFSDLFSSSNYNMRQSGGTLDNYEVISNMFISMSKKEFSPWEVYLQYGKTGVMLHFYLESSSETLATKALTLFCPFLFGTPYQISFSVFALGKKVDSGFLPDHFFENEIQAANTVSNLLNALFTLQLCLGIYDEKLIETIRSRQASKNVGDNTDKSYEIDSKFLLFSNHCLKPIRETIRSANPQRPCTRLLSKSQHAERCQNCRILSQNTNLFHEHLTSSDKCSCDSHTALSKLSFEELLVYDAFELLFIRPVFGLFEDISQCSYWFKSCLDVFAAQNPSNAFRHAFHILDGRACLRILLGSWLRVCSV